MKARERTRLHKILKSVGLVTLLLLVVTWYLCYSTTRHMKGLLRDQILEIRRGNRDGNTLFVASDQGISMEHIGVRPQEAGVYLSWASTLSNRGKTMATGVGPRDPAKD